jgi:ribonuclease D
MAEQLPKTMGDLRHVGGVLPRLRPHAQELLEALGRAAQLPDSELPVLTRTPRPVLSNEVLQRVARLKEWRVGRAKALEVDVSVVLPQRLIDRVAAAGPRDLAELAGVEGLRRWRVEAFGDEILAGVGA